MKLAAFSFDLVNKRNLVSMAATLLLCLSFSLHSDTLELAQPEPKASMPAQGLKMADVKTQYGAAVKENPPVGKPAITRWDYDNYSVYFENEYVIHSVAHKRNPKSSDNKHAASNKSSNKPGSPLTPESESTSSESSSAETATEEPTTAAVTTPENPIAETVEAETVETEIIVETATEGNIEVEGATGGSPDPAENSSAAESTEAVELATEEAPTKKDQPHSRR